MQRAVQWTQLLSWNVPVSLAAALRRAVAPLCVVNGAGKNLVPQDRNVFHSLCAPFRCAGTPGLHVPYFENHLYLGLKTQ